MRSLPVDSLVSIVFIFQGLFLGSIGAANNKEELKNLNITHILTVANSFEPTYPNDFVYKIINGKNVVPLICCNTYACFFSFCFRLHVFKVFKIPSTFGDNLLQLFFSWVDCFLHSLQLASNHLLCVADSKFSFFFFIILDHKWFANDFSIYIKWISNSAHLWCAPLFQYLPAHKQQLFSILKNFYSNFVMFGSHQPLLIQYAFMTVYLTTPPYEVVNALNLWPFKHQLVHNCCFKPRWAYRTEIRIYLLVLFQNWGSCGQSINRFKAALWWVYWLYWWS